MKEEDHKSQLMKEVCNTVDEPNKNDEEDDHSSDRDSGETDAYSLETDELPSSSREIETQDSEEDEVKESPSQDNDQKNVKNKFATSPCEVDDHKNDKEKNITDLNRADEYNSDKDDISSNPSKADNQKSAKDKLATSPAEPSIYNYSMEDHNKKDKTVPIRSKAFGDKSMSWKIFNGRHKTIKKNSNNFESYNKFACLGEHDVDDEMNERTIKTKSFHIENDDNLQDVRHLFRNKKSKRKQNKVERFDLQGIETFNRFQILVDKSDEDLRDLIRKAKLENIPKHKLNRCRKCVFKSRKCLINSNLCKASQRYCVQCKKAGHFPQSLNCKNKRKKSKNNNGSKINSKIKSNIEITLKPEMKSDDIYHLLIRKINYLESFIEMQKSKKKVQENFKK